MSLSEEWRILPAPEVTDKIKELEEKVQNIAKVYELGYQSGYVQGRRDAGS